MAEDNLRKAADNALLTLVARWFMVGTLPLGLAIGGAVYNKLDKTSDSTARLEEQFKALIDRQLPDITLRFDGRMNAQSDRLTAHDKRLDRLEDWRNARGNP